MVGGGHLRENPARIFPRARVGTGPESGPLLPIVRQHLRRTGRPRPGEGDGRRALPEVRAGGCGPHGTVAEPFRTRPIPFPPTWRPSGRLLRWDSRLAGVRSSARPKARSRWRRRFP